MKNQNQNTDGNLLPCPFCGNQPKIFIRKPLDYDKNGKPLYWYVCQTYRCGVGVTHGEWTEEAAREKWNTRYVDDVL